MTDLHDATQAPNPAGGWSSSIVTVGNALIAPTLSQEMIQPMGVFDAQGTYLHQAVLWRGRPLMTEPARPSVEADLAGRWIWGGVLLNHFGHFLTESTGRLWALDAVQGPVDGLIFVSKRDAEETNAPVALQKYHEMFFDMLGMTLPIRIVTRPTQVEVLEVPGQGFGIGPMASGTAEFRSFMENRFAKAVPATGGEKLYISRSGLSASRGGILEEARLERLLAASGYEIYHPQKHPLTDQVARYKGARQIVALDGSALHLFAMAGHAGQQVAVIKRRDSSASDSIVNHLAAFLKKPPVVVDVILRDWVRSDRKRADRFSLGELDFASLGAKLLQAGFITDASDWHTLTEAEGRAAVEAIQAQFRKNKLAFSAMPRRADQPQRQPQPVPAEVKPASERHARRMAKRAAEARPTERRKRRMEQNG